MPLLHIISGATVSQLPLHRDRTSVGGDPGCDIVVPGEGIDREHACIHHNSGQYFIEDCQSRHGTFVNGRRVAGRMPLQNHDLICIADFEATFLNADEPGPKVSEDTNSRASDLSPSEKL